LIPDRSVDALDEALAQGPKPPRAVVCCCQAAQGSVIAVNAEQGPPKAGFVVSGSADADPIEDKVSLNWQNPRAGIARALSTAESCDLKTTGSRHELPA
jgi:hypothetical protein